MLAVCYQRQKELVDSYQILLIERRFVMKKFRRVALMIMAIGLAIPMFTLPAKASVQMAWAARIAGFQSISVSDRNNYPGYTTALQLFLSLFDDGYASDIATAGGFDGWYGTTTADCVELFMLTQNIEGKRVADAQTWACVANNMDQSGGPTWYYFKVNGGYCMNGHPASDRYEFRYYIYENGGISTSEVFHWSNM